ncbi:hypothetical protein RCL1_005747 [Eukaryota sp. TZLM3-RCL]
MLLFYILSFCVLSALCRDYSGFPGCTLSPDGSLPPAGYCAGPIHRSLVLRQNLTLSNKNCPLNKIPVHLDREPSVSCVNCVPGVLGIDDTRSLCKHDEFCSDDGNCEHISSHPLFLVKCPFDTGSQQGQSFCGGLRCVLHRCVSCREGEVRGNSVCVRGVWQATSWRTVHRIPNLLFLFLLTICAYGIMLISLSLRQKFSQIASLLIGDIDHEPPLLVGSKKNL